LLEKYKKMVNNCIVIRVPSTAEINFAIANSILAVVKTSIYKDESYILKVGEISTRAILLLEGNLNVITFNQNDNLGKFSPGDFYATDLGSDENVHFNERFFKKTQRDNPPKLQIPCSDNFDNRSVIYLIAIKFVTVGYIDNLESLYSRHPSLKHAMQSQNRYMFDVGRRSIEHHLQQRNKSIT
jgi:hypothetical protein